MSIEGGVVQPSRSLLPARPKFAAEAIDASAVDILQLEYVLLQNTTSLIEIPIVRGHSQMDRSDLIDLVGGFFQSFADQLFKSLFLIVGH